MVVNGWGGVNAERSVPCGELVPCQFERVTGPISRIYLGVDDMGVGQGYGEEIVEMGGEGLEAGLIAHEAMDVDEQEGAAGRTR